MFGVLIDEKTLFFFLLFSFYFYNFARVLRIAMEGASFVRYWGKQRCRYSQF